MANEKRKGKTEGRFRVYQIEILVVIASIILIVTAILDFVILELTGKAMQNKTSDLISANSRQLELNINSYLERMETTCTLLFSDDEYYLYDATDPKLDEYEKIKKEDKIRDRIVDIGLMENYSDFGIVFSDDHKVGWISHGTEDLFPEGGVYDTFSKYIVNPKKNDGWCFGVNGCTDRMFYIKRLNPNAILVTAIYTMELSSEFIYPELLEDMTIRLVDQSDTIMFSSDQEEIGKKLPDEIRQGLERKNKDYIIYSNVCRNDWRVVSAVPTKSILQENIRLRKLTLWISIGMAALFFFVGLLVVLRLSKPVGGMVTSLQEKAEIDRLSGVMNKGTFQEETEKKISNQRESRVLVFVMLDVDNFKQVNDKLGHAYGDQVIIRFGNLLRKLYDSETLIGRQGGDEFAIFTECVDVDRKEVVDAVRDQMDKVFVEFHNEFESERESCDISLSGGVYVTEEKDLTYKKMFDKADGALYTSKNLGKARYTLVEEP